MINTDLEECLGVRSSWETTKRRFNCTAKKVYTFPRDADLSDYTIPSQAKHLGRMMFGKRNVLRGKVTYELFGHPPRISKEVFPKIL